MKTYFLLLNFLLIFSAAASAQTGTASAQTNEDLMDILKKETEAFANADFEAWKSYWCHTENAYFSYSDQNGAVYYNGWDAVEKAAKELFEGRKKIDLNLRRENVKIERQEQMAFITFDQYDNFDGAEVHKAESRVMKKTNDGWKILSTEVVDVSSFSRVGKQLHHILLASFKPEAKSADIQYIFDKFNSIVKEVEGMTSCTMLKNQDTSSPFQYTFIMTFRTEEALNRYNAHANHLAAVERWKTVGDKVTVIDSWQ